MNLRDVATNIVRTLQQAGHQACFVGGCVRDSLMGHTPTDYDVATSATPEDIRRLFRTTIPVGEHFGVILVVEKEHRFEVATFRSDGDYSDGRHPDSVTFGDLAGDVRRRDFTVNGMMFDPVAEKLIDLVGGQADLDAGIIRAIGDPARRFAEDHLRLMRAVRFAARLNFRIEPETRSAMVELADQIKLVSWERIAVELEYMLSDPSRGRAIGLLDELGLLEHILPEVTAMKGVRQNPEWHPEGDAFVHTVLSLNKTDSDRWDFLLAVLLHDIGKPLAADGKGFPSHERSGAELAGEVCRRLKVSKRDREVVVWLIANHMRFCVARDMKESTLKRMMTHPLFEDLAELHRIDALASAGDLSSYDFVMERYRKFLAAPAPVERIITGKDLIERGLKPGPVFSEILEEVYDAQLEGEFSNREGGLHFLGEFLTRRGP